MTTTLCWFLPSLTHKPQSKVMQSVLLRLQEAYSMPGRYLRGLQRRAIRQIRGERRHAMISLLQVMVYYADHETFKVGRYTQNGWRNYSLHWLANKANISWYRAKRAFSDLLKKGYVVSQKQLVRKDGQLVQLPSIKKITFRLFQELQVLDHLDRLKIYKRERRIKKEKKQQMAAERANVNVLAKPLLSKILNKTPLFKSAQTLIKKTLTADETRKLSAEALACHHKNPSKPPSYYFEHLRDTLLSQKEFHRS